jgi:hypothetical protein
LIIDSRLFDILLVDSHQGQSAAVVTPPPSTQRRREQPPRCFSGAPGLKCSFLPQHAASMLCDAPVRKPHTHVYILHPFFPGRDHSRSPSTPEHLRPPSAPLTVVAHVTGPDRQLPGMYETMFGSIGTFFIESVPTVLSSSWPASVLASDFRVGRSEPCVPAPSHRHPLP